MRSSFLKKTAVVLLTASLAAGSLTGCSASVSEVIRETADLLTGNDQAAGSPRIDTTVEGATQTSAEDPNGGLGDPIEPAGELGGFAYGQLDSAIQDVYAQLYAGISAHKTEFTIRAADTEDIKPALSAILTDCPEFFWIDGTASMSGFRSLGIWKITLNYVVEVSEIEALQARVESKAQEYLSSIPEGASDYDKVKLAYEYIINTTDYALGSEHNQNILSVFLNGSSVCAGYARAFQYLLDRAGVWCTYVEGTISDSNEGHAWNLVRIGDIYTYVDPSWGDPTYGEDSTDAKQLDIIYDYLCLTSDELLRARHIADTTYTLPECTDRSYDYYILNGMYHEGYSSDSVSSALWRAVDNGISVVYLKFSDFESYSDAKEALFPSSEDVESLLNAPIRQRMEWDEASSLRYYYSCSDELWIIKIYW